MSFAHMLRCDLANRAKRYADARSLPNCLSYGASPVVCFKRFDNSLHGNFLPASYKAITSNPQWRRRLAKVHTSARRSLPHSEKGRWRELDSCISSDALLMNVFCYPRLLENARVAAALGLEPGLVPRFGFPARVPLQNNQCDSDRSGHATGRSLGGSKGDGGQFPTRREGEASTVSRLPRCVRRASIASDRKVFLLVPAHSECVGCSCKPTLVLRAARCKKTGSRGSILWSGEVCETGRVASFVQSAHLAGTGAGAAPEPANLPGRKVRD